MRPSYYYGMYPRLSLRSGSFILILLLKHCMHSLLSHSCCIPCPSHCPSFNNHNSIWRVQIKRRLKSIVFWVVKSCSLDLALVSEEHIAKQETVRLKLPIMLFSLACFDFLLDPNSLPQHPVLKPRQFTLSFPSMFHTHSHNWQSSCLTLLWGYNLEEAAFCKLNGIFGLTTEFPQHVENIIQQLSNDDVTFTFTVWW